MDHIDQAIETVMDYAGEVFLGLNQEERAALKFFADVNNISVDALNRFLNVHVSACAALRDKNIIELATMVYVPTRLGLSVAICLRYPPKPRGPMATTPDFDSGNSGSTPDAATNDTPDNGYKDQVNRDEFGWKDTVAGFLKCAKCHGIGKTLNRNDGSEMTCVGCGGEGIVWREVWGTAERHRHGQRLHDASMAARGLAKKRAAPVVPTPKFVPEGWSIDDESGVLSRTVGD